MISPSEKKGRLYTYYCLAADVTNLEARAEADKCWSGSCAYCIDTGDLYMYDAENKQWRKQ